MTGRTTGPARGSNHLVLMFCVLAAAGLLAAAGSELEGPEPGAGARAADAGGPTAGGTLTVAWEAAPRTFDPAFATDRVSANVVMNVFEPLVRLGPDLELEPALARAWDVSENGMEVTFHLRRGGRWTNGEPVTAADFVFAWRRVLTPELGSPLAPRLYGIAGAAAYHRCTARCAPLAAEVGVEAAGPRRLVVRLAAPQPWFVRTVAQPAFLPLHRETLLRYGRRWTRPGSIVSNGPFALGGATATELSLVRNPRFRAAARVALARVEARVIPDATARVQAFDGGSVLVVDGGSFPRPDLPTLRERREFRSYPTLRARLFGFNLTTISDARQRRAMALAVDRETLVENVTQRGEAPATRFVPTGAPAYGRSYPDSPWLPPGGDLAAAQAELDAAAAVRRQVTLIHPDEPGSREVALFLRSAWRALGIETAIRSRPADAYLAFEGPLARGSADVYQVDLDPWIPEAWPALALWTCRSDGNKTNFCNGGFDRLLADARREPSGVVRSELYARAELVLSGAAGTLPAFPVYWPALTTLESLQVKDTYAVNPLGQVDFSAVDLPD